MSDDFDFSCIPCAGKLCFAKPVAERRACTQERHLCPYQIDVWANPDWQCRCCDDCMAHCEKVLIKEHYAPG